MNEPRVVNRHHLSVEDWANLPENMVYIGRGSPWGNPFPISNVHGGREIVIVKYEDWVNGLPALLERAKRELKGKTLVCFCAPKACHGDVLLRIANERD